tara:strand:+ start:33650 stop:34633 length:984 start_codon:yes stop_codon:yes gene_type:complete
MSFGFPSGPRNAWTLGSLRGVPIRVQPSLVWLIAFVSIWTGLSEGSWPALLGSLAMLTMVTLSVLAHELGHAFIGKREGVEVLDITLWPLGGVAMMRDMPEDPGIQARVALAGPVTNLILAVLAWGVWMALGASGHETSDRFFSLQAPADLVKTATWVNLFLGLTNLLPAFPMDGAKVLQAALARNHGWLPATEITARVGKWMAIGMIVAGFVLPNFILPIIGVFTLISGTREVWRARLRHAGQGAFDLGDLPNFLRKMAEQRGAATGGFGASSTGAPPGFDPFGTRREQEPDDVPSHENTGGFSEDDVANLESFKGRLQRPEADGA